MSSSAEGEQLCVVRIEELRQQFESRSASTNARVAARSVVQLHVQAIRAPIRTRVPGAVGATTTCSSASYEAVPKTTGGDYQLQLHRACRRSAAVPSARG